MGRLKKERGGEIEKMGSRYEGKRVSKSHMVNLLGARTLSKNYSPSHSNYQLGWDIIPTRSILGVCLT